MSNTKKILSFIFLALLTLVLVGCELPTPNGDTTVSRTESEARKDLETASSRLTFSDEELVIERDEIALATSFGTIKGITYTWTSSNEQVIKVTETEEGLKGIVSRPEEADVEVTLTCTIAVTYSKLDDGTAKKGSVTETKEFTFTVKKIDKGSEVTIKEAKELAKGETVTLQGIVVGLMHSAEYDATKTNGIEGLFIADETAGVYVYSKNGGLSATIGDRVEVTGVTDNYYGSIQIAGGSDGSQLSVKVVESGQTLPDFVSTTMTVEEIQSEMLAGYNGQMLISGSYQEVYAKVSVETSGDYTNAYIVDPYNNNIKLQVYYKTGFTYVEGLTGNTMVESLKAFDGKYVRISVIPYSVGKGNVSRICFAAGKITEVGAPTITDEDLANQTKTKAEQLAGKYTAGETVALFTTDEATGATVTWVASVEGVIDLTTGLINEAATDQEVTLTATITKGEVTVEATVVLTIKAKPTEEPVHAGTEEDPFTASDAKLMAGRLDQGETGTDSYYVKGEIVAIKEVSTSYGNAEFTISDGTTEFICFRAKYLGNVKFTAEDQIKVGMVVVVYGKFTNYNGTLEFASGCYITKIEEESTCNHVWNDGIITTEPTCTATGVKTFTCSECGDTKTETVPALGHTEPNAEGKCDRCGKELTGEVYETKTLAEFVALEDSNEVFYQIEGVVTNIANTTYGNLYITDGTTVVYVYGLCSEKMELVSGKFTNTKDFSTLGVEVGMHIVIVAAKTTFSGTVQAAGSGLVSKSEATDLEKLYVAKANLKVATSISDTLTLPTYEGVTITWTSNSSAIVINEGVATVNQTSEEQTVVLTAVLSLNGEKVTVEFTVKVAAKLSGDTKELTFDFVTDTASWADWNNAGYASHEISSNGFTFTFSKAKGAKSGESITDAPVICAKGGTEYVTVSTGGKNVTSVTFNLKAWGSKKYNTLQIEYQDAEGNWVSCGAFTGTYDAAGFAVSAIFETSVTSFRLAYSTTTSKNTQCGFVGLVATLE